MASLPQSIIDALDLNSSNRFVSSKSSYYWDSALNMAFILDRKPSPPLAYIIGFTNYSATSPNTVPAPWDSSGNLSLPRSITINNSNKSYVNTSNILITIPLINLSGDSYFVNTILDPTYLSNNYGYDYSYYFPLTQANYPLKSLRYFNQSARPSYSNLIAVKPAPSAIINYTCLGDSVFENIPTLVSVDFGSSDISYIGNYCFSECLNLQLTQDSSSTYFLFQNIETIGDYAFSNCNKLTSRISNTIVFNSQAISQTSTLNKINFIGGFAFNNTDVVSISIPKVPINAVNSPIIVNSAFGNCPILDNFTINKNMYQKDINGNLFTLTPDNYFGNIFLNSSNLDRISVNGTQYNVGDANYILPYNLYINYNNNVIFDGIIFVSKLTSSICVSTNSVTHYGPQNAIEQTEFFTPGTVYEQYREYSDYIHTSTHNFFNENGNATQDIYKKYNVKYQYNPYRPLYKTDGTLVTLNNAFDISSNSFYYGTLFNIGICTKLYDLLGLYCDIVVKDTELYYIDSGNILKKITTDNTNYVLKTDIFSNTSSIKKIDSNFKQNNGYRVEMTAPYVVPFSSNLSNIDTINFPVALYNDTGYKEIYPLLFQIQQSIPGIVTYTGNGFKNDNTIKNITFSEGTLDYFSKGYFMNCSNLRTVVFPNLITTISEELFKDCVNLETVTLPETIGYIGKNAFRNCLKLNNINLSTRLQFIGESAFQGCERLAKTSNSTDTLILPNSLKTIGAHVFDGCKGIVKVKIGSNLKHLPDYSFQNCTSMVNVDYGAAQLTFGIGVFQGCNKLGSINLPQTSANQSDQGALVSPFGNNMFSGCSSITELTIPIGTKILSSAFLSGLTNLTSLTIPNTVTEIPTGLFSNLTSLKKINSTVDGVFNLPDSITTIGNDSFKNCSELKSLNLPNGLSFIGDGAFQGCSYLQNLNLPKNNSVSISIGNNSFDGCSSLTTVDFSGVNINTISQNAFSNCTNLQNLTFR